MIEENNKVVEGIVKIMFVSYVMVMLISLMIEIRDIKQDLENIRYEIKKDK
jgi:hypothetical protein